MQKPVSAVQVAVKWDQEKKFSVTTASGAVTSFDGSRATALSPMEALLAALCGCMGIDVVSILAKMRADLKGFTVRATGEQNPEPPRFFRDIHLTFTVQGDVAPERVEHAVQLSFKTYCSVYHSLRRDLRVSHIIEVVP